MPIAAIPSLIPLQFLTQPAPLALDNAEVLGGFEVGVAPPLGQQPWPVQRVAMPCLDGLTQTVHEGWLMDGPSTSGKSEGIAWRQSGELLFGVIDLHETDATVPPGASALRQLSEQAYQSVFRLLDQQGVPHLWRLWNFIPDINGEQAGLERYRHGAMRLKAALAA